MNSKQNKLVILGHSGFIGSHLESLLSKSSNWDVIGRSLPDIDLTNQEQALRLIPFLLPETVLVLAAAVKRQFGDTLKAYGQNMAIIENICRLLETYPVKRIIFMSSAAVYGEETENTNISELTSVNPTSYYGIYKYTAECLLRKACTANQKTSLVCLRPPLVYGPNDQGRTYGPSGFSAAALEGTPITLWGDGTELREFIYIEDLCWLIEFLTNNEFEGELNVVSGTQYCFADAITILKEKLPSLEVNTRSRSKQKANNAFDARKIKELLPTNFGFTSLEEGLARILNQN
jgi:nucleoside-diphosphate-sugar epimerase